VRSTLETWFRCKLVKESQREPTGARKQYLVLALKRDQFAQVGRWEKVQ
jgi:hypothetical protein